MMLPMLAGNLSTSMHLTPLSGARLWRAPLHSGHFAHRRGRALQRQNTTAASRGPAEPDPLLNEPCPVPWEQQPMQEFKSLKEAFLFDWADLPLPQFVLRLAAVWGGFLLALGLPVSVLTFDLSKQPVECLVAASTGSLFLVLVLVLRLYLGYAHVGGRLLSANIIYEETGWYDGQVWTKTPQMLMRDRLLGIYTVKPAMQRLKYSLFSLAGGLVLSVVFLALSPPSDAQPGLPAPAPLTSSSSRERAAAPTPGRDYWEAVAEFEPWALEREQERSGEAAEEEGLAGRPAHMLGSGSVFRY